MESTDSFKSQKILHSSSKNSSSPFDQDPWNTKTPDKPVNPPRRVVRSLKEVTQAALALRKSGSRQLARPDPLMSSSRQQIPSSDEMSPVKPKKQDLSVDLPEKYEILDEFFKSLASSIPLLRLKKFKATFANISAMVERSTDRRFTRSHLAQLKYILPEAIEIQKVMVPDERTNCMKPDLQVTLNVSSIENKGKGKSDSASEPLRKIFRARLVDFFKAHPEGDEVPEEALPRPFGQSKQYELIKQLEVSGASLTHGGVNVTASESWRATASNLPHSFKRKFSARGMKPEKENSEEVEAVVPSLYSDGKVCLVTTLSHQKGSAMLPLAPLIETPTKNIKPAQSADVCFSPVAAAHGTPAEFASTPAKLMSATPSLQPPKRCYMSPDEVSIGSPDKLTRRPSRSRSLKFDTPSKGKTVEDAYMDLRDSSADADVLDILSGNLGESIREKERTALMENDPAISQAKWRRKIIAGLPKLFDSIHFLFQSMKASSITKEELVHKIVSNNIDIVDKREVEEQLTLLKELVPEWIYEEVLASSGIRFIRIKKIQSPESIRTRLAKAMNAD